MDFGINDIDLSEVSEFIPTEKNFAAWDLLTGYIADLHEAAKNKLEELGYIDKLLELGKILDDIKF